MSPLNLAMEIPIIKKIPTKRTVSPTSMITRAKGVGIRCRVNQA